MTGHSGSRARVVQPAILRGPRRPPATRTPPERVLDSAHGRQVRVRPARLPAARVAGYVARREPSQLRPRRLPDMVAWAGQTSRNPRWVDGAQPVADVMEDVLRGDWDKPVPLDGKAAEAASWAFRRMLGLGGSLKPTDAAALRDALHVEFG
jgi:hypothetical protein